MIASLIGAMPLPLPRGRTFDKISYNDVAPMPPESSNGKEDEVASTDIQATALERKAMIPNQTQRTGDKHQKWSDRLYPLVCWAFYCFIGLRRDLIAQHGIATLSNLLCNGVLVLLPLLSSISDTTSPTNLNNDPRAIGTCWVWISK
jgi:hypothetical protein